MAPHSHHRTTLKHRGLEFYAPNPQALRILILHEALSYICCHRHRFISFLWQLYEVGLLLLSLNERKQGSEKWHGLSKLISDRGFPGDLVLKNLPANAGDVGSIPRWGRSPGEGQWQPTPVFLPGTSHEQRSLERYNPWSHKESETTYWLNNKWQSWDSGRGLFDSKVGSLYNKAESQELLPESGRHTEQVRWFMPS